MFNLIASNFSLPSKNIFDLLPFVGQLKRNNEIEKIEIIRESIALGRKYETLVKLWEKNSDGEWEEIK